MQWSKRMCEKQQTCVYLDASTRYENVLYIHTFRRLLLDIALSHIYLKTEIESTIAELMGVVGFEHI